MCLTSRFCFPFWLGFVQPLRVTVLDDIRVRRRFLFMKCEIDDTETLCGRFHKTKSTTLCWDIVDVPIPQLHEQSAGKVIQGLISLTPTRELLKVCSVSSV